MAKAYWIATYFSVSNPDALAEYAKLAGPAISAGGGRFLARGTAAKAYEKGLKQRSVLIEFDSSNRPRPPMTVPAIRPRLKCSAMPASATCASSKASDRRGVFRLLD
jgi:uncharacterized protein (DUF1330 family)